MALYSILYPYQFSPHPAHVQNKTQQEGNYGLDYPEDQSLCPLIPQTVRGLVPNFATGVWSHVFSAHTSKRTLSPELLGLKC